MHTCGPKDAYKSIHSSSVHNCQYWKNPNVQQNSQTGGIFIQWNKYNSDNEWIRSTCNYMYDSQKIMMRWKEANTKAFPGQMIYLRFNLYNVQKQSKQYTMAEFRVAVTPGQGVVAGRRVSQVTKWVWGGYIGVFTLWRFTKLCNIDLCTIVHVY